MSPLKTSQQGRKYYNSPGKKCDHCGWLIFHAECRLGIKPNCVDFSLKESLVRERLIKVNTSSTGTGKI
jgi:hypothetical protein